MLFNEEYEINYDSRVVALDQIRMVFIKMLSAYLLIGLNQLLSSAIELVKTFLRQITGATETSSTITLLVTNSIGLVENGIQVYVNLLKLV